MPNILKVTNVITTFQRNIGKNTYKWHGEGVKYPGFTYYPRTPDFKDPPYEPSKLLRVDRIKPLKGRPYWERNILKQCRLEGKDYSILKNIPEIISLLWRIKHLIKITPITFPNGFPEDSVGTYLKENGELVVSKKLAPVEDRLQALDKFENDTKKIDGDTLRRDSLKKWNLGSDMF